MRMGLDPRKADQQVRDVVVLTSTDWENPSAFLFFAQGEGAKLSPSKQALIMSQMSDEWIKKIQDGWTEFRCCNRYPGYDEQSWPLGPCPWTTWS